jgi:hypothetical protein
MKYFLNFNSINFEFMKLLQEKNFFNVKYLILKGNEKAPTSQGFLAEDEGLEPPQA